MFSIYRKINVRFYVLENTSSNVMSYNLNNFLSSCVCAVSAIICMSIVTLYLMNKNSKPCLRIAYLFACLFVCCCF